jgi:carboxypeptidase Taq
LTEGKNIDDAILHQKYDVEKQKEFMNEVMSYLKVNEKETYLGESAHPFTIFFSTNEARMTTHYYEDIISSAILSTVHEYGHALYSLQVDSKYDNTIFKDGIGMAMHESQSRFLENYVGRSKAFWEVHYPALQAKFPEHLSDVTFDQFYEMLHVAKPGFIRTEADELTYPIHILIRYELEKEIFDGTVDYENLDKMWNDKYEEYLGIRPDKDSKGILQDMHWSAANLGYFPTYALGSAYAAQFYNTLNKQMDVEAILREGKFEVIRDWLKENIHQYGAYLDADEILLKATGETFNPDYYINYLKEKYGSIYGIK